MVEEWHPSAGSVRHGVAVPPDGVVESFSGLLGVKLALIGESAVDVFGDLGRGEIHHRPEGGDDMGPAGVLQSGCQGDGLVGDVDAAEGGLAGRQEDELTLMFVGGQVGDGQPAVIEQQTTPGWVVEVLGAMAAKVGPGVAAQFVPDGLAGGLRALPEGMTGGEQSDEQIAFAVDAGQFGLAWGVAERDDQQLTIRVRPDGSRRSCVGLDERAQGGRVGRDGPVHHTSALVPVTWVVVAGGVQRQ
jgi:hypothetical protein